MASRKANKRSKIDKALDNVEVETLQPFEDTDVTNILEMSHNNEVSRDTLTESHAPSDFVAENSAATVGAASSGDTSETVTEIGSGESNNKADTEVINDTPEARTVKITDTQTIQPPSTINHGEMTAINSDSMPAWAQMLFNQTQQLIQTIDTLLNDQAQRLDNVTQQISSEVKNDMKQQFSNQSQQLNQTIDTRLNDLKLQNDTQFQNTYTRLDALVQEGQALRTELNDYKSDTGRKFQLVEATTRQNKRICQVRHNKVKAHVDKAERKVLFVQSKNSERLNEIQKQHDDLSLQLQDVTLQVNRNTERMTDNTLKLNTVDSLSDAVKTLTEQVNNLSINNEENSDHTLPINFSETDEYQKLQKFACDQTELNKQQQKDLNHLKDNVKQLEAKVGHYNVTDEFAFMPSPQFPAGASDNVNDNSNCFRLRDTRGRNDPQFQNNNDWFQWNDRLSFQQQTYNPSDTKHFLTVQKFKKFRNFSTEIHPRAWIDQFRFAFPSNWTLSQQLEFMCGYLELEPEVRMRAIIHKCTSINDFAQAFLSAYWAQPTQDRVKYGIILTKNLKDSQFPTPVAYFEDMVRRNQYLSNPYSAAELIRIFLTKIPRTLRQVILASRFKNDLDAFREFLQELEMDDDLRTGDNESHVYHDKNSHMRQEGKPWHPHWNNSHKQTYRNDNRHQPYHYGNGRHFNNNNQNQNYYHNSRSRNWHNNNRNYYGNSNQRNDRSNNWHNEGQYSSHSGPEIVEIRSPDPRHNSNNNTQ